VGILMVLEEEFMGIENPALTSEFPGM